MGRRHTTNKVKWERKPADPRPSKAPTGQAGSGVCSLGWGRVMTKVFHALGLPLPFQRVLAKIKASL